MNFNTKFDDFYRKVDLPCIVYDLENLRSQLGFFKKAFEKTGRRLEIAYSYKTNILLAETLYKLGCKLEITGETHLSDALNFAPGKNIVLTSPTLNDSFIEKCLAKGVHVIADSINQLEKINKIAKSKTKVGLRINNKLEITGETTCAGSKGHLVATATRFGFLGVSEENFTKNLNKIKGLEKIELVGIHNHIIGQNNNLQSWKENAQKLLDVALKVKRLEYINIGGGYPIKYQDDPLPLDEIVSAMFGPLNNLPKKVKVVTEPGRFLAGPCGTLLAEVVSVKKDVVNTAFLNTSIFATFPDRLLSRFSFKPPIEIANKSGQKGKYDFYIRGNSVSSVDFFGVIKNCPKITEGDIIAVRNIGAYGTVQASSFCGAKKPIEYLIDGKSVQKCKLKKAEHKVMPDLIKQTSQKP